MPELPLFLFVLVLVIGAVLLLRRDHRNQIALRRERQRLDVQNHVGDPDDPTTGSH